MRLATLACERPRSAFKGLIRRSGAQAAELRALEGHAEVGKEVANSGGSEPPHFGIFASRTGESRPPKGNPKMRIRSYNHSRVTQR